MEPLQQMTLKNDYFCTIAKKLIGPADEIQPLHAHSRKNVDILRRARKVLPKPTCQMLYNTLVLLLFDYCSPVWGSCGVRSKAYLDKLNRHAACIIEGRSIGAEELKSTLGWPSLQARKKLSQMRLSP